MSPLPRLSSLLRNLFRKDRVERDLDSEVSAYLDQLVEEKISAGMAPEQARRAGRIEVGGPEQVKEQVRAVRAGALLEQLVQDIRYGARQLLRSPGFMLVAVVTLALGIGANTVVFSVVNAVLLQPLPFPRSERLVLVWETDVRRPGEPNIVSWPNYEDWKGQNRVFQSIGVFDSAGRGYNLSGTDEPEQVSGVRVSGSFFDVLGVKPLYGRTFLPEEETPGKDRVVILSHGLWQRRYGGDATLVGRAVEMDGERFTVVGIMPPEFRFQFWSGERRLWVPIALTEGDRERGSARFCVFVQYQRWRAG